MKVGILSLFLTDRRSALLQPLRASRSAIPRCGKRCLRLRLSGRGRPCSGLPLPAAPRRVRSVGPSAPRLRERTGSRASDQLRARAVAVVTASRRWRSASGTLAAAPDRCLPITVRALRQHSMTQAPGDGLLWGGRTVAFSFFATGPGTLHSLFCGLLLGAVWPRDGLCRRRGATNLATGAGSSRLALP